MSDKGTEIHANIMYGVATGSHSTGIETMYNTPKDAVLLEVQRLFEDLRNAKVPPALDEAKRRDLRRDVEAGEAVLAGAATDRSRLKDILVKVRSVVEQMALSIAANVATDPLKAHWHDLFARLQNIISALS